MSPGGDAKPTAGNGKESDMIEHGTQAEIRIESGTKV